jgi:hypothetical protein
MRSLLVACAVFVLAGCSSREERAAVSTTTVTSSSIQPISLIGETKSGLRVNLEQNGAVDDDAIAVARPAKLTLRRGDRALLFRTDGEASKRVPGAFEFSPTVMVITKSALEDAHEGDPARFVETFSQVVYGDSEKVTPPALSPSWNALVLVTEQGQTTVETVSLRKVRR